MATASFITDSPKTSEYMLTSTFRLVKMARTVTGSVALMSDPNSRFSSRGISWHAPARPRPYISSPTTKVDTAVPTNANMQMAPKFRKNGRTCIPYPASKMMGGSRNRKKNSFWNAM